MRFWLVCFFFCIGLMLPHTSMAAITFGVYPGGPVGIVGTVQYQQSSTISTVPLLHRLCNPQRKQCMVRLYDAFTERPDADLIPTTLTRQLTTYTTAGYRIEVVLRYRPTQMLGDVDGFSQFVRSRVKQLSRNSAVISIQVTNEFNITGSPDVADGAYAGVTNALVAGVIAAHRAVTKASKIQVGFNWAFEHASPRLFQKLSSHGGRSFMHSVDWVGVDAYPGTWGPPLTGTHPIRSATVAALAQTRYLMRRANLQHAALHVAESGFPTGKGRTKQHQKSVLRTIVRTVIKRQQQDSITQYTWFDLYDADTQSSDIQRHYGLASDDGIPKPAFAEYARLINQFGTPFRIKTL